MSERPDRRKAVLPQAVIRGTIQVSVPWLYANVRCGDDPTWQDNFRYIERNHYSVWPNHWDRFLEDISFRGVIRPVVILVPGGSIKPVLQNGHHRFWGAFRRSLGFIPAVFCTETRRTKQGPAPYVRSILTNPYPDMPTIDNVIFEDALPSNPYPFVKGLGDYLATVAEQEDPLFQNNVPRKGVITDDKAKRILWIVSGTIDGYSHCYDLERLAAGQKDLPNDPEKLIKEMIAMECNLGERNSLWRGHLQKLYVLAYEGESRVDLSDEWKRLKVAYDALQKPAA